MPQHILFEDDGAFKAGTVLSSTDASHQVELASGKRTKVKSSHVLLRFEAPAPGQLMTEAQSAAQDIELDFLWECAPQEEFDFQQMAREYHGRAPGAVEAAAILFRLHGAPVYFHRKGRGRFRPAPADVLKAALAALERKRQQEALKQQYVDELKAGGLPEAIRAQGVALILRPDKNSVEYKAVEQAAAELHMLPLRLLLARGAIASAYRWHLDAFMCTTFPRGTGFPADLPPPPAADDAALGDLPLAPVAAFSIDDSTTTEIDDAFSLQATENGQRIGVHIAAPALSIVRDHPVDAAAKARMSTVYAPGFKITMLPERWIAAYSLDEGRVVPVLSLYVDVPADVAAADPAQLQFETRVERVRIAANLRHDLLDQQVSEEAITAGTLGVPFAAELTALHRFAQVLLRAREAVRGKPEPKGRVDYSIELEGEGEDARVALRARRRGAPLDSIVAELMILANSHWGGYLAQQRRAGIYRSQSFERGNGRANGRGGRPSAGRVRMSTTPGAHDGIGVASYAWCTSPLRRYVDLLNQRQLIAAARNAPAPYAANDADLFSIVSGFDAAYTAYAEFQQRLEHYWCLRWLQQESVRRIGATVLKGDVLRLDGLPFVTRLPGLPELPRGQRVELDILSCDEVNLTIEARLHQVLTAQVAAEELAEEDEEEVAAAEAQPQSEAAKAEATAADAAMAEAATAEAGAPAAAPPSDASEIT
jgi:exoribonuclease-2